VKSEEPELNIEPTDETIIEEEDGVLVLTEKNFDKAIEAHEFILVEFYAPWCGHCKKLAPEYVKAAKALEKAESSVKLAKVDATVEKSLGTKFGVRGYPTLKFFKSGKPQEYKGPRDGPGIVQWLEKKTGPPAVPVNDMESFEKLKENPVVVVGVFKDQESDAAKEFIKAAGTIEDHKIVITSDDEVKNGIQARDGWIIMFKNFDTPRVKYEGEAKAADIEAWINEQSIPSVWEFSSTNAQKIFATKAKVHFLYFIKGGEDLSKDLEPLKKVSADYKNKVTFAYVDVNEKSNAQVTKFFGIDASMAPMYTLFEMESSSKYMSGKNTAAEVEAVKTMVEKYFAGELEKTLKSEDIPEDWDKQPVKVLVGKNFADVAMDKSKDVFVEFYAPWCGHCKKLAPTFDELGEKMAGENVDIIKMDATANDVPAGFDVRGFPTLFWLPSDSKTPVAYNGGRELDDFVKYIAEKATKELNGFDRKGNAKKTEL
jgi:protein disulfide-isomerase A1